MDKHLNFGVYKTTESFKAIKEHSCVCFDDMTLVAVTGPAEDKESQKYSELFAAAPDLLKALKSAVVEMREDLSAWGDCDHSVGICYCSLKNAISEAVAAISRVEGETVNA
jgi:hypothetical protein